MNLSSDSVLREVQINLIRSVTIKLLLSSLRKSDKIQPGGDYYRWFKNHLTTMPYRELMQYPEGIVSAEVIQYFEVLWQHPENTDRECAQILDQQNNRTCTTSLPDILFSREAYILAALRDEDDHNLLTQLDDEQLSALIERVLSYCDEIMESGEIEMQLIRRFQHYETNDAVV